MGLYHLSHSIKGSPGKNHQQYSTWLREYVDIKELDLFDMPNECIIELKSNQQSVELVVMEDFGISLIIQITDYSDLNKLLSVMAHVLMIVDRLKRRIEPPCHVGPSYLNKAEYLRLRGS